MGTIRRLYVQSSGLQQLNYQKAAQDQSAIGSCKKWVSALRGHNGRVGDYHRNSRRQYLKQTLTRFCTKCALFKERVLLLRTVQQQVEGEHCFEIQITIYIRVTRQKTSTIKEDILLATEGEKFNQDELENMLHVSTSTTTTHNAVSIFMFRSRDDTQV